MSLVKWQRSEGHLCLPAARVSAKYRSPPAETITVSSEAGQELTTQYTQGEYSHISQDALCIWTKKTFRNISRQDVTVLKSMLLTGIQTRGSQPRLTTPSN